VSIGDLSRPAGGGVDKDAVRLAIGRAARATGADFTYLLNQAKSESGLNPHAKASTSSAAGLYQFIDQSWLGILKQHGAEHGYGWAADAIRSRPGGGWTVSNGEARRAIFALRNDPDASALMAGEFAQDNAARLSKALGRDPTATDLYFAHFLGLAGASRFLKAADADPDATAASLFPREARANRAIFYAKGGEPRSLSQIYALMGRKIGDSGAPTRMTEPVRMAALDTSATAAALGDAVVPVDVPESRMAGGAEAALAGRGERIDVLRPSPKQAMLAYLVVSTPYQA